MKGLWLCRWESGLVNYMIEIKALPWKDPCTRMVNATWCVVPQGWGWGAKHSSMWKNYVNCGAFTSRHVMQSLTRAREMGISEKYQVAKEYVHESALFLVCVHACAHAHLSQHSSSVRLYTSVWCWGGGMADGRRRNWKGESKGHWKQGMVRVEAKQMCYFQTYLNF